MLATLVTAVVSGLHGARGRAPIRNAGFAYPASRITVNLAPADRRKHGAAYDLAIGVGILVASEQIRAGGGAWALLGELSLGGALQGGPGGVPPGAPLAPAGARGGGAGGGGGGGGGAAAVAGGGPAGGAGPKRAPGDVRRSAARDRRLR